MSLPIMALGVKNIIKAISLSNSNDYCDHFGKETSLSFYFSLHFLVFCNFIKIYDIDTFLLISISNQSFIFIDLQFIFPVNEFDAITTLFSFGESFAGCITELFQLFWV